MNIVLIVSDTFRFDNLTCAGNTTIRTPELDRLAAESVCCHQAHVSSFPTIPHRTDMLTGTYGFPFYPWRPLQPDQVTLQEMLKGAGYVTQLIGDCPHLMKNEYNFSRGFDGFYWVRGQEGDIPFTGMNYPIPQVMQNDKTRVRPLTFGEPLVNLNAWTTREWAWEEDTFCAQTARHAAKWLEDNYKADRFFLYVDFFDVHEPWSPPQYLVDMYDSDYDGPPMPHPNYGPATAYTKAELKNLWAHYAGEVTLVSKWIGYLLRKLEDVGLSDDTIVCFTADHGMYVGEHNRCGKSNICDEDDRGPWPLYDEITRIPLTFRVPGAKPRKLNQLLQPVDIMPTLLDLVGVEAPPGTHGHSLAPLMRGEKLRWSRKYTFSSQHLQPPAPAVPWTTVRDRNWAFLVGGKETDSAELYDLKTDPQQSRNVIRRHPDRAAKMHAALIDFLTDVGCDDERLASVSDQPLPRTGKSMPRKAPDYD